MNRLGAALLALTMLTACSSEPAAEPAVEPTPTLAPQPAPTSNIVVSDAVPTLDELRDMGITDRAAECFIATIDPDGTGRVQSVELFMEAFGTCL